MTVDEIRELIALAGETGIAELEVQRGDNRVRIRRASFAAPQEIVVAPAPYAAPHPSVAPAYPPAAPAPPGSSQTGQTRRGPESGAGQEPHRRHLLRSPLARRRPFVRTGERVQPGKVLCIIESMKLMNEIEAEASGVMESKLVMNGQPVEYGEALFAIRTI